MAYDAAAPAKRAVGQLPSRTGPKVKATVGGVEEEVGLGEWLYKMRSEGQVVALTEGLTKQLKRHDLVPWDSTKLRWKLPLVRVGGGQAVGAPGDASASGYPSIDELMADVEALDPVPDPQSPAALLGAGQAVGSLPGYIDPALLMPAQQRPPTRLDRSS